jgi:mannose-6-phosphate isomerase-like protein (cupin superfamily)
MRRRRFLQSSAGVFPLMMFQRALFAADQPVGSAGIELVKAGDDVSGHALQRPISTLAFKVTSAQTGGRLFVCEHTHHLKGGPPLHVHHEQEEWFLVEDGEVVFQVGDRRMVLKPGDSLLGPRGVPHTFSATGDAPAKLLIAFSPAGKMEDFFRDAQNTPIDKQDGEFYRKYGVEWVGPPIKV